MCVGCVWCGCGAGGSGAAYSKTAERFAAVALEAVQFADAALARTGQTVRLQLAPVPLPPASAAAKRNEQKRSEQEEEEAAAEEAEEENTFKVGDVLCSVGSLARPPLALATHFQAQVFLLANEDKLTLRAGMPVTVCPLRTSPLSVRLTFGPPSLAFVCDHCADSLLCLFVWFVWWH
jgi:hypothetical protein